MPWSNNNGGGWKSGGGGGGGGGGGPWGQGPSGGNQPPDLEELLKRSQDRLKQVMPGGSGLSGLAISLLVLAAIAAWGASGFYTVRTNEVALNLVFGKYIGRTGEGLNYNWPYPIGSVVKLPVTDVRNIEIGTGTVGVDNRRVGTSLPHSDSLMLTADENIVDVAFSVLWRISAVQPKDYVFNIQNPEGSIRAVAESAMREVVGRRNLKNVLPSEILPTAPAPAPGATPGALPATPTAPAAPTASAATAQNEILDEVRKLMQQTLDQYGAGVVIDRVNITRIGPPPDVLAAFSDVQAAVQERDRLQNEALTHASRVVPVARGQAQRIMLEADAYRQRLTAEAEGAAARFQQVFEEYRKAPQVTRERMYLETMERVLGGTDKILIDKGTGGQGVVPYLPLNELQRRAAPQPPTQQR